VIAPSTLASLLALLGQHGVQLWMPELGGPVDAADPAHQTRGDLNSPAIAITLAETRRLLNALTLNRPADPVRLWGMLGVLGASVLEAALLRQSSARGTPSSG
jgi:hypothetical protein